MIDKPNIVVSCIDHTEEKRYIKMLKYWIHKYKTSNTEANLNIISDTKTSFLGVDLDGINLIKIDIDNDKDYKEIKKSFILRNKRYYDHNMAVSDILRFGKAPSIFKNLIVIDIDAIIENKLILPSTLYNVHFAGCDHGFKKRLNIGFVYLNKDITSIFLNKVIDNIVDRPWFCEDILSDLWKKDFGHHKLPQEYNWIVGFYGTNDKVYVNHYWQPTKFRFNAKQMLAQQIEKYLNDNDT